MELVLVEGGLILRIAPRSSFLEDIPEITLYSNGEEYSILKPHTCQSSATALMVDPGLYTHVMKMKGHAYRGVTPESMGTDVTDATTA